MYEPTYDNVLLELVHGDTVTVSGLVVPEQDRRAGKKTENARVIAVGPGRVQKGVRLPMSVRVGDLVLIDSYAGTVVSSVSEPERVILPETEIEAVLERG